MVTIKKQKTSTWRESHNKRYLKNPEYRKTFDALEPEFAFYSALIDMRKKKKMTQKELASRIGTQQSSIARFESGSYGPSFDFVNKIANALGLRLRLTK